MDGASPSTSATTKPKSKKGRIVVIILLAILLLGALGFVVWYYVYERPREIVGANMAPPAPPTSGPQGYMSMLGDSNYCNAPLSCTGGTGTCQLPPPGAYRWT